MSGSAQVLQRAGVVSELPALLGELGADVSRVFSGTGIDPAVLLPETRLAFADLAGLLDRAARATGCPDLGLTHLQQ